jgi:hypothetical protein
MIIPFVPFVTIQHWYIMVTTFLFVLIFTNTKIEIIKCQYYSEILYECMAVPILAIIGIV